MSLEMEEWMESNLTKTHEEVSKGVSRLDYISDKSPNPNHAVDVEKKYPQPQASSLTHD
jgi:hypothetical protein